MRIQCSIYLIFAKAFNKHADEVLRSFSGIVALIEDCDKIVVILLMAAVFKVKIVKGLGAGEAVAVARAVHVAVEGEGFEHAVTCFMQLERIKAAKDGPGLVDAASAGAHIKKEAFAVATQGHHKAFFADAEPGGIVFRDAGNLVGLQKLQKPVRIVPCRFHNADDIVRRRQADHFGTAMQTMMATKTNSVFSHGRSLQRLRLRAALYTTAAAQIILNLMPPTCDTRNDCSKEATLRRFLG